MPYDVIDKWLDEEYNFGHDIFEDNSDPEQMIEVQVPWATRKDKSPVSCWSRPMYQLMNTKSYDTYDEDENGYVEFTPEMGFVWTAEEWTDEMIDQHLGLIEEDEEEE